MAEMMVVMLILSIIMAAMAPVMTSRNKLDQSSPWSWAENGSDAYYGLGDAQVAMIGQDKVNSSDDGARLIVNSPSGRNHILFKADNAVNGLLNMSNYNVFLGKLGSGLSIGTRSTGLGYEIGPGGQFSTALGYKATSSGTYSLAVGRMNTAQGMASAAIGNVNTTTSDYAIALGSSNNVSTNYAIAIGYNNDVNGTNAIVLGKNNTIEYSGIAIGRELSIADNAVNIGDVGDAGTNAVAIGYASTAGDNGVSVGPNTTSVTDSIAIGSQAHASTIESVAIGNSVEASGTSSIAIGSIETSHNTTASGISSIAIGDGAYSTNYTSIAIGYSTEATNLSSIALGSNAHASAYHAIAIGTNALAKSTDSISIGQEASAGHDGIAIGRNACKGVVGSRVTCIGANSGPASKYPHLSGDSNVIYLGDENTTVFISGNLAVRGTVLLNGERGRVVLRPGNAQGDWAVIRKDDYDGRDDNLRGYPTDVGEDKAWYDRYSDRRLKYVGKESTSGLDKIRQLKVFNFTFKKDKEKTPHVGVIAQDLQKVFPNAVSKAKDGFLRIRFEDMFYAMINAIKELDTRILVLEKENQQLKETIKQIQNDNKKQEARLKALEAKIK